MLSRSINTFLSVGLSGWTVGASLEERRPTARGPMSCLGPDPAREEGPGRRLLRSGLLMSGYGDAAANRGAIVRMAGNPARNDEADRQPGGPDRSSREAPRGFYHRAGAVPEPQFIAPVPDPGDRRHGGHVDDRVAGDLQEGWPAQPAPQRRQRVIGREFLDRGVDPGAPAPAQPRDDVAAGEELDVPLARVLDDEAIPHRVRGRLGEGLRPDPRAGTRAGGPSRGPPRARSA